MEEIWKDIEGYEGFYQVSNIGRVKSLDRKVSNGRNFVIGKILKQRIHKNGYIGVILSKENKLVNKLTHRLVLSAFIPNPKNLPQVNHINGIKNDNRLENLEWCTRSENNLHAYRKGLSKAVNGEKHFYAKLKKNDVEEILQLHSMYGLSQKIVAKEYSVAKTTISLIINRINWKHIQI